MWGLPKLDFTKEHEWTLRALQVDEDGPGTILHDFEALLAFVDGRNLPVSKTHQLPPLKVLPELNALLKRPIEVRLKRPQLKSYPHLQGLYLLLRATGIGQISRESSKPALVIDQQAHDAWLALNPTEQYFTLLEAWLLRGEPEIVGERSLGFITENLMSCASLLQLSTGEGWPIAENPAAEWSWYYSPGRMGLALLEMFGFLSVATRPPEDGEGWIVERIYSTPLGEATFALLKKELPSSYGRSHELVDELQISFGALRPAFAPYVPQWEHTLKLEPWAFREGTHVFRASLGRAVWRQIAIDAGDPVDALAGVILDAFEFGHDHLYEFRYRNRFGVEECVHHPYMDEGPWTTEMRVGELPLAVGQSMTYLFDFGDQWEFQVELQRVDPAGKPRRRPMVLDGRGKSPEQYRRWDE